MSDDEAKTLKSDQTVFLGAPPAAVEAKQPVPALPEPATVKAEPWWVPVVKWAVYAVLTALALRFGFPTPPQPVVVVQPAGAVNADAKEVAKELVKQLNGGK